MASTFSWVGLSTIFAWFCTQFTLWRLSNLSLQHMFLITKTVYPRPKAFSENLRIHWLCQAVRQHGLGWHPSSNTVFPYIVFHGSTYILWLSDVPNTEGLNGPLQSVTKADVLSSKRSCSGWCQLHDGFRIQAQRTLIHIKQSTELDRAAASAPKLLRTTLAILLLAHAAGATTALLFSSKCGVVANIRVPWCAQFCLFDKKEASEKVQNVTSPWKHHQRHWILFSFKEGTVCSNQFCNCRFAYRLLKFSYFCRYVWPSVDCCVL